LLFREVPGQNKRIQATFTEETYYHGHSITPFLLNEFQKAEDLYPILAVSNSKLISWYVTYKSSNFSKNTFPKLNPKDIKELPVPKNIEQISNLGVKANTILKISFDLRKLAGQFCSLLMSKFEIEKLTTKLDNWYDLEFKGFLKELRKSKVKLSLSEEAEWMQYFNEQKEKAQTLKSKIAKTDNDIDQMVYELYGLNEKEIKIVEGEV